MPAPADLFQSAWAVYRLVVEHDYLWHTLAARGLAEILDSRFGERPFRFLDLACGDSDTTSRILAGRNIAGYVGVDRSVDALSAAEANVAKLGAPTAFATGDFVEFLEAGTDSFDAIYIGLSAHHLDDAGLARLFAGVRRRLAPEGLFVAFEPFSLPDETRAEHHERFCAITRQMWLALSTDQREQVVEHVLANDRPVPLSRWNELATAAGLSPARCLARSPDRLYELVAHT